MSNIFHELKRGFLILGFTGPLSSGCTTAARFFEKDLNTYIDKRCEKGLPKLENDIKTKYRELRLLKEKIDATEHKSELYKKLKKLSHRLKENLLLRETLTILHGYKSNNFKYISMTDVLLKLTIESLTNSTEESLSPHIKKLKKALNYDPIKLKKATEICDQIKNREISDIKKADIDLYEDFLFYIRDYREELKKHLSSDELGTLLQDLGDNARRCGNPIDFISPFKKEKAKTLFVLAEEANNIIKFYRNKRRESYGHASFNEFVIEAFRNPYEIEYFRNRYYEFFLFSVYAPLYIRKKRGNYNQNIDIRDRGQNIGTTGFYKQNVSECVHLSDIAINNV